jgi:hypothetical protein
MEVDDDFKSSKPVAKAPQEVVPAKHHNEKLMLQQLLQD